MVKHGNVTVKLVGEDGNAFNIIARTAEALKRQVSREAADEFVSMAYLQPSYEDLQAYVQATVHVV